MGGEKNWSTKHLLWQLDSGDAHPVKVVMDPLTRDGVGRKHLSVTKYCGEIRYVSSFTRFPLVASPNHISSLRIKDAMSVFSRTRWILSKRDKQDSRPNSTESSPT